MANSNKTVEQKIGQRIGTQRVKLEITQQELSELCGVKRETINQWESGTRQIKAGDLLKLSKHLKCTTDYLVTAESGTTHDISYIVEQTGLTENSVELLNRVSGEANFFKKSIKTTNSVISNALSGEGCLKALNTLLESDNAENILQSLFDSLVSPIEPITYNYESGLTVKVNLFDVNMSRFSQQVEEIRKKYTGGTK